MFGKEPLGGVDSGNVDLEEITKAIHKALDLRNFLTQVYMDWDYPRKDS